MVGLVRPCQERRGSRSLWAQLGVARALALAPVGAVQGRSLGQARGRFGDCGAAPGCSPRLNRGGAPWVTGQARGTRPSWIRGRWTPVSTPSPRPVPAGRLTPSCRPAARGLPLGAGLAGSPDGRCSRGARAPWGSDWPGGVGSARALGPRPVCLLRSAADLQGSRRRSPGEVQGHRGEPRCPSPRLSGPESREPRAESRLSAAARGDEAALAPRSVRRGEGPRAEWRRRGRRHVGARVDWARPFFLPQRAEGEGLGGRARGHTWCNTAIKRNSFAFPRAPRRGFPASQVGSPRRQRTGSSLQPPDCPEVPNSRRQGTREAPETGSGTERRVPLPCGSGTGSHGS